MIKLKTSSLILIAVIIILLILAIILVPTKKKEGEQEPIITSLKDVNIAQEIYGFSGQIKAIKDKVLVLEASILLAGETAELTKANVKIAIADQTKLTKMKFPKEPTEEDKPVFPEETPLNFSELKVEDRVNVVFIENVSDKLKAGEQLTAKGLFIIEK